MSSGKIIILILLSASLFACSEIQDAFYVNIDEAMKRGAIEKGWIPNILPRSSYEIYERHDVDTNTVWLRFRFDSRDIQELIAQVEEVKPSEIATIEFSAPNVSWWPKNINKDSFAKGHQPSLKLYKYKRVLRSADNRQTIVAAFFAVDWNSNIAYYWH